MPSNPEAELKGLTPYTFEEKYIEEKSSNRLFSRSRFEKKKLYERHQEKILSTGVQKDLIVMKFKIVHFVVKKT